MDAARKIYRGDQFTFWVLNRYEAAQQAPDEPYIVVSIRDPGTPEPALSPSPLCRAVLRLQFHDRSRPRPGRDDIALMTPADASALLLFVQEHLPEVRTVVCHCDGGLGRSPAVAAALSRILQNEDRFFFNNFAPNEWVYRTILTARREPRQGVL